MAMQITPAGANRNWSWWAGLHRLDRPSMDLTRAIVSATTRKTLGEPAGTFTLTLKASFTPGAPHADLLYEVADDDWIVLGATDPAGNAWIVMVGLVDSVRRQRFGTAAGKTYTIQGRDLGKILVRTDMLDMPWLGADVDESNRLWGNAAVAEKELNALWPRSPGAMVDGIMRYCLAAGKYRSSQRLWAVPQSIVIRPVVGEPQVDLDVRQASDVIARDHIDKGTRGIHAAAVSLPVGVAAGGGLWALMSQLQNPLLNELHYDVIALPSAIGNANAYCDNGSDSFNARPSVRLREKPFPALSVSDDAWGRLPVTTVRESDLEAYDVGKSGAERFSWFCVEPGFGDSIASAGAMAMLFGKVAPEDMWDAMPAVFQSAIERHGLARYQQPTPYLNPALGENDLWFGHETVRLLRDWYAPNPVFLSGTATIASLSPGVRIGERLRVVLADGGVEEFYIEGVDHRYTKNPDGSSHGSTTVSITRGWRLESTDADYRAAVLAWLRDNLEAMT